MSDLRYFDKEKHYLELSYDALQRSFFSLADFNDFYFSIKNNELKNDFLRVCSFYFFLSRFGSWKIEYKNSVECIDYIDSSFKLIAIVSLIESLHKGKNLSFSNWCTKNNVAFPIGDIRELKKMEEDFNRGNSSSSWVKKFFSLVSEDMQKKLLDSIKFKDGDNWQGLLTIDKFCNEIYRYRSEFVHANQFALNISSVPVFSNKNGFLFQYNLSIKDIELAFEAGVIAYFRGDFA